MSSEHSPNGSTSHEKESLINGHSHQETESPVRESFKTDTGMDKYSLSSKYSSSFTPEENHNGIVINGRGGGEHEELDRFSESLNGSFSMDYKIPERPKGNTMEALHWDIDQRNDKIQRLNKKLENSMFENVRLTFSEPTRKQIRTSQDMEVQARNDQISKLQQQLANQKQDEVTKSKKEQEKNLAKQKELQFSLDKMAKDKQDLDSKWKQKSDINTKNYLATQHELSVENKRLKEEIQLAKKGTVEAVQLKDDELKNLQQLQEEQIGALQTELQQTKSAYASRVECEQVQKTEQLKAESNTLLAEARKKHGTMETEKIANEKALNARNTKLEDMLTKKSRETEHLLRQLDEKKVLIDEQHRMADKTQKETYSTTLARNEEFENKFTNERNKSADAFEAARENYLKIIAAKDDAISKFEAEILKVQTERENMEQKLNDNIARLSDQLKETQEDRKNSLEALEKKKAEQFENMQSGLSKEIATLKHEMDQLNNSMQVKDKEHKDESTEMVNSHKAQLQALNENMQKQIKLLKDSNLKERAELENFYHKEMDKLHAEKKELLRQQEQSRAELQEGNASKALFEGMKDVEMKSLKDQVETMKREKEQVETDFKKALTEAITQKDHIIAELKSQMDSATKALQTELDQKKSQYEKGQFEMEQQVKQIKMEMENCRAEGDSYCKKRDREIEKLIGENKTEVAKLQSEFARNLEEKEEKIKLIENKLQITETDLNSIIEKLKTEYELVNDKFLKEKSDIIDKNAHDMDETHRIHFEMLRDINLQNDNALNDHKNLIRDRDLRIKDLEEIVKSLELKLEEQDRNWKGEMDLLQDKKTREIETLLEEIGRKNKHIDLITTLHQSELKQLTEKFKSEMSEKQEILSKYELESQQKVGNIRQKHLGEQNEKDETIAQLKMMLKEVSAERDRAGAEGRLKLMLQREEWCASENALNHQHVIDLNIKEEEIEALNAQMKEMKDAYEKDVENLQKTVEQYRIHFENEMKEMAQFREDLRNEKETEHSRLNEEIAQLNAQKTQLKEDMLNQENQLQEFFFKETTILKNNFTIIRTEIEQKLHDTEIALQNMTHERDRHVQEGLNKDARIQTLESDLARVKNDLDNKIDEMAREVARLNEERKQMFEAHQKAMEELLEEKRQMEIFKDKEFQEMKLKMTDDMKKMRNDLLNKISQLEEERNNLDLKIKDMKQKHVAMIEEKDNELAKYTRQTNEKHQTEISKMTKQFNETINSKDLLIENLNEDLKNQKHSFEEHLSSQKTEFEKTMNDKDLFIRSIQEQHESVCRDNEEHIENLKRNIDENKTEFEKFLKSHNEEIKEKTARLDTIDKELSQLRQELTSAETEAQLAEVRGEELRKMEDTLKVKHSEIHDLSQTIQNMQIMEKDHTSQIEEQNKQILTLSGSLNDNEAKLRQVTGELLSSQKTAQRFQAEITQKDKQLGDLNQKCQQEKYTREAKEKKTEELKAQVSNLSNDLKKKEDLVGVLQKKVDDFSHAGAASMTSNFNSGVSSVSSSRRSSVAQGAASSLASSNTSGLGTSSASSKWAALKNEVMTKSSALNKSSLNFDYDSTTSLKLSDSSTKRSGTSRETSPKRSMASTASSLISSSGKY